MNDDIAIRLAERADSDALAVLCGELGYPTDAETMTRRLDMLLARGDLALLVACSPDDEVIGVVHVVQSPGLTGPFKVRVPSLVVSAAWRGRGVGRALMAAAADWGRGLGAELVELSSQTHREAAHQFYRRLGFEQVKTSAVFRLVLKPAALDRP